MNKFIILQFDLTTNTILGYWNGDYDLSVDIDEAITYDSRDEVRYQLGAMLKDIPAREFQYRTVTQTLVIVP